MRIIAPAKINLTLNVTGKRDDGYHLLHSIVAFTKDFGDEIEITPADEFRYTQSGMDEHLPKPENNLIVKCAKALSEKYNQSLPFHIHLNKKIPIGAGLGGGSSDTAAVIKALLQLWDITPNTEELQEFMLSLGADVPLCYHSKACIMEGIGEKITPITLDRQLYALLVYPHEFTPTPAVFKDFSGQFSQLKQSNDIWAQIKNGQNDLTESAVKSTPIIEDVLYNLSQLENVLVSRMSGSGSCCFALFDDQTDAEKTSETLQRERPHWWMQPTQLI